MDMQTIKSASENIVPFIAIGLVWYSGMWVVSAAMLALHLWVMQHNGRLS
jgi:hypothetical protein